LNSKLLLVAVLVIIIGASVVAYILLMPPSSRQATVAGRVTDVDTGTPVSGATVSVNGKTVTTASDGTYSLTVELGSYTLSASKEGYNTSSQAVEATEVMTYTLNVVLTPSEMPPSSNVVLKIITRHGTDITYKAEQAFLETDYAKRYNIVDIQWIPAGPTLWVNIINMSGDIDAAWGGGPVLFDTVYAAGQLAPLTSADVQAVLNEIPEEIVGVPIKRYGQGQIYWVGAAISSFGFTINTQYLADTHLPVPSTWADLANETYAVTLPSPSVGTADATKSTSNTRMFEIILQGYGWEGGWKILTLKGANSRIYDQSESVRDAVMNGEIGVGTTIDYYGYTAQLENPGVCEYILPEDGTVVNGDPIALLTTSPHKAAAQAFIAWELSAEGQKIWLDPSINRLPVNRAVFDTPEGQARADLEAIYNRTLEALVLPFSDDLALSYEYSMMWYYHATIVRPQLKLVDAWMQLTIAKEEGRITQQQFADFVNRLTNPTLLTFIDPATGQTETFTQEYAISLNEKIGTDATFRTEMVSEWQSAAEARYDSIVQELGSL
jgi:ABC-type Fe3+ transport system substrate-binding protein